MKFKPHKYQKQVIDFAMQRLFVEREQGAGFFMDPGLGKTACTLSVLESLDVVGDFKRALVIAPVRVIHNVWPQEVRKWQFQLGVSVCHGTPIERERALLTPDELHLVNPESLP